MIKPTVGRIVHYVTTDEDIRGHHRFGNDKLAAMVVGVHSDTCVNLAVFGADGSLHPREKVMLAQGPDRPPAPFAEWMDYQKGQAAKTDALMSELQRAVDAANTPSNPPPPVMDSPSAQQHPAVGATIEGLGTITSVTPVTPPPSETAPTGPAPETKSTETGG